MDTRTGAPHIPAQRSAADELARTLEAELALVLDQDSRPLVTVLPSRITVSPIRGATEALRAAFALSDHGLDARSGHVVPLGGNVFTLEVPR